MSTAIKGRVIHIGTLQSGTSQAGKEWTKQDFTLEFGSTEHPESMTITAFPADKIKDLTIGTESECFVNFRAKEYNGKYYNGIDLWKVVISDQEKQRTQLAQQEEPKEIRKDGDDSDLPF